jgi:hypothetical protein
MNISQRDVIASAVLILYIVFFGTSPPAFVQSVLSNPIGAAASFGLAIYVTLYYSKPVGGLLIVALLAGLSRSGSRENFDVYTGTFNETGYLNANPDVKTNVQSGRGFASGKAHWDSHGKREGRQGSGLTKVTLTEGKSYKCSEGGPAIYLFKDGKLNGYPNPEIAASWDPNWGSAAAIPCADVPKGPTMAMKTGAGGSAGGARTYQTLANTDYTGQGDIRVVTGDVSVCKTQCDSTTNCKGFVQTGTTCYLKNASVSTPRYVQGLTYHYTGAAPSAAASAPAAAAAAPKPKPVMACNIENFAAF